MNIYRTRSLILCCTTLYIIIKGTYQNKKMNRLIWVLLNKIWLCLLVNVLIRLYKWLSVISYRFCHFVPTFIFILVISYQVWSFRTQFDTCNLVTNFIFNYNCHYIHCFISNLESFRITFSHFVLRQIRT